MGPPPCSAGLINFKHPLHTLKNISQTPQCMRQISHNAPFVMEMCTYVLISVTKWCIVGYGTGALWDLYRKPIPDLICLEPISCHTIGLIRGSPWGNITLGPHEAGVWAKHPSFTVREPLRSLPLRSPQDGGRWKR